MRMCGGKFLGGKLFFPFQCFGEKFIFAFVVLFSELFFCAGYVGKIYDFSDVTTFIGKCEFKNFEGNLK